MPPQDPLADGPVIQGAATRALERGATLVKVLDMVRKVAPTIRAPLVLFTYYNPIIRRGLDTFCRMLKEAGASGAQQHALRCAAGLCAGAASKWLRVVVWFLHRVAVLYELAAGRPCSAGAGKALSERRGSHGQWGVWAACKQMPGSCSCASSQTSQMDGQRLHWHLDLRHPHYKHQLGRVYVNLQACWCLTSPWRRQTMCVWRATSMGWSW